MTSLDHLFHLGNIKTLPLGQERSYNSYKQPSRPQTRNLFGSPTQKSPSLLDSSTQNMFKPISALFTTPLRRTERQLSKTSLQNYNMIQEIDYFKQLSQQQFLKKSLIITVPLILLTFFGLINNKVCFELILLGISLLMNESMFIQSRTIQLFVKTLPVLTYTALFYDVLTSGNHGGYYYVTLANLPSLLISLAAAINFIAVQKLSFLGQQNLKSVKIHEKPLETLQYLFKSYIQRIKNRVKLYSYIGMLNLSLAFIFVIYCIIKYQTKLFIETVYTIPSGVIIFALIDVFVYLVEFLAKQISFFKLNKHFYQLEVCMSLLRLRNNAALHPENTKIHHRCLIQIAKQLKHNSDYLQTPVKVNYAINNVRQLLFQYRDIFEIYASQQLSVLHTSINLNILQILKNNKIINSTKSMKEDAFIHFRKLFARFQNNILVFKILSEIEKRKLVFLIMIRLSRQSPLKTKILETLNQVRESIAKATNVQEFFEIGQKKLKDWIHQLETLQKSLRNDSLNRDLSHITERDEHGWAHYRRPNTLNIQSI